MPERAGGGWYPKDNGPTPQDRYVKWLHDNEYEDSPERRAEFAGDAAGLEELLSEDYGGVPAETEEA